VRWVTTGNGELGARDRWQEGISGNNSQVLLMEVKAAARYLRRI